MNKVETILSKTEFIQYLKYLKIFLKEEVISNIKLIENIEECIEIESKYTPSAYYYAELSEDIVDLIKAFSSKDVIKWSKIPTWKAYLRKYKIEKIMIKNDL